MADKSKQPFGLTETQLKNLRVLTARATVRPVTDDDDIKAAMDGILPRVTNGEPTKLLVTAWMCHEGINNNRLAFRAEDLEVAAKGITAPNLLPMDWNHAAVFGSWDPMAEPPALGVWYEAAAKFNPEALGGKGALGVEVKGVVWAWAFPEKATEMLAMQAVKGYIEFSMACIPESLLQRLDEEGKWYDEAVNPVFFTLSALTVPPGDPDAKGSLTNLEDLEASDRLRRLTLAEEQKQLIAAAVKEALSQPQNSEKEAEMDKEMLEALNTSVKAAQDAAADEKAKREAVEEQLTALKTAKEAQDSAVQSETLKAEALAQELAKATEVAESLKAELETAKEKLAEFEAAETAKKQAELWAARLAELPESYRAALEGKEEEERKQFAARWSAVDDATWKAFAGDLQVAFSVRRPNYLDRSGTPLPVGGSDDLRSKAAALLK